MCHTAKRIGLVTAACIAVLCGRAAAEERVLFDEGGGGQGWSFASARYCEDNPRSGQLHFRHAVVRTDRKDAFGNATNRFGITGAKLPLTGLDWEKAELRFYLDTHGVVLRNVVVELCSRGRNWKFREINKTLATFGSEKFGYHEVRVPLKEMTKDPAGLLGPKGDARITTFLINLHKTPDLKVGTVIDFDDVRIVTAEEEKPEDERPPLKFVSAPRLQDVTTAGGRLASAEVTFELSRPADCVVRIFNDKGKAVRHLAAGMLGDNAPSPLAKGKTVQRIAWDGKDDDAKPLPPGAYTLKVQAGMRPTLGAILGEDPKGCSFVHPVGIEVGPKGEVYLLHRAGVMHQSASHVYAFDRHGRYRREIVPPNPNIAAHYAGARHRSNATGSVWSWANRFETAALAYMPTGYLFSLGMDHGGSGTYPVVRKLVGIRTDGQHVRDYANGPPWVPKHWHLMWLCPTSPKSILISDGAPRSKAETADARPQAFATKNPDPYHVVGHCLIGRYGPQEFPTFTYAGRRKLARPRAYLGELRQAGDGEAHFNGPAGVAVDRWGNIYVADSGNNRVQAFRRDGYFLRSIKTYTFDGAEGPLTRPQAVLIDIDTGAMYVTIDAWAGGKAVKRLIKFARCDDPKTVDTVDLHELAGFNLALDASAKPRLIWTTKGGGPATFSRIEDLGGEFGNVKHFGGRNQWKLMQVSSLDVDARHTVYCADLSAVYKRLVKLDGNGGGRFEVIDPWPPGAGGYSSYTRRLVLTPDGAMAFNMGKAIARFDRATGKPLKFSAAAKHAVALAPTHFHSLRGLAVGKDGALYTLAHTKRPGTGRGSGWRRGVAVFNPDGTVRSKDLLGSLPAGLRHLDVDRTGAVWLFSGAKVHRYRGEDGRLWSRDGFSYSRYDGCGCMTSKMCVDDRLYAYVPDERNCRVRVLDANGNFIADIGSYGNRDCRGRFGKHPDPPIPLQNPIATAVRDDRLYIADYGNLRIVRVDLQYALEAAVKFRNDGKAAGE